MRLASRCPFVSNNRTILLNEGSGITQMDYLCGYLGVARGSELPRIPLPKLFGKYLKASRAHFFGAKWRPMVLPRTPLGRFRSPDSGPVPNFQTVSPRTPVNKGRTGYHPSSSASARFVK